MSLARMLLGGKLAEAAFGSDEPVRTDPNAPIQVVARALRRDRLALAGLVWIALILVVAIAAPLVAPYPDQGAGRTNVSERLQAPSPTHVLGTDELGRDMLSRIIYGTRPALIASFVVVLLALAIGLPLGALAGLLGGWVDEAIMRTTDLFLAFPSLLLAMAIVALMGPSLVNAVIALAISWWPWYARLVRGVTVGLKELSFVEAAKGLGAGTFLTMRRHILPNCLTPVLIQVTLDIGTVILAATGLAFLGLGAQPPQAEWGLMIEQGRGFIRSAWWYSTFPGLAIFLTVLAFNLVGDSLRDIFDPRQQT